MDRLGLRPWCRRQALAGGKVCGRKRQRRSKHSLAEVKRCKVGRGGTGFEEGGSPLRACLMVQPPSGWEGYSGR